LWIAFHLTAESSFRYFYALFLPVVWAATRQGMIGAVFCVVCLQFGLVLAGQLQTTPDVSLIEIQMRILVLALVGFFIGVSVDEQTRAAHRLRDTLRLVTAGEMAGAIAHELNQPLTALSAYSSACRLLVRQNQIEKLTEVVEQIIGESNRASNIVRRLRDLFGAGATSLTHFVVADLLKSATQYFQKSIANNDITLNIADSAPNVRIYGDEIQLDILIRNLLVNARDAIKEGARRPGVIDLAAYLGDDGKLHIRVTDNGAGIAGPHAIRLFDPFFSTKSSGLGLGLAICTEIATAHGGTLALIPGEYTCFELTLPIER
jgi:C4-dicarboxylate-specific signal transduction histidine kinase